MDEEDDNKSEAGSSRAGSESPDDLSQQHEAMEISEQSNNEDSSDEDDPEVQALLQKEVDLTSVLQQFSSQIEDRNEEKENTSNPVMKSRIQDSIRDLEDTRAQKETELRSVKEQIKNAKARKAALT